MKNKDFCKLMVEQEKQKRSNGDESTADLYRASRNHYARFIKEKKKSGLLGDVTQELVQEYIVYLQGKDLKVNSMNSYISNLRSMYNRACRGWKGRPSERPFEGIQLKREETVKRAVPVEVIKQLATLDLKAEPEKKLAADMGTFSFLTCGIPFVDIAHLTVDNLIKDGTVLSFYRQKTGALIEIVISEAMQVLIDRYKKPDCKYLFPVLQEGATYEQYKYCLAQENKYLGEIQKLLGLSTKLTTYVFRHSWASAAYHLGIPIAIISQALGHSSEKMTRIYLSAFDADKIGEANKMVSEGIKDVMAA